MQLFKAHNQWKTRPADERFQSVRELHDACTGYRHVAAEAKVAFDDLRVEADGGDLRLVGKTGVPATLSNWAMTQVSQRAGAPADYLRKLPATLAAQNLNHGLRARTEENRVDGNANLLFHANGSLILRAVTTDRYVRIWNSDITQHLLRLQQRNPNWVNPKAYQIIAPGKDGGWPTLSGEMVPAGLYASDHDMFAFLVDESRTIKGSPTGLKRGFFVWNSEVGAASFGIMTFLYDTVCGNNIVWGASNVSELRIRHVGRADAKVFGQLQSELIRYSESSASDIEVKIESARKLELGVNREDTLENVMKLVSKNRLDLSQKRVNEALQLAETREDRYGNPRSLWAVVGGLTEASQFEAHADTRMKIDRAAGKLLTIAF